MSRFLVVVTLIILIGSVKAVIIRNPQEVAEIFYALCPKAASMNLAVEAAYESNFKRPIEVHVNLAPLRLIGTSAIVARMSIDWMIPCGDVAELCRQLVILDENNNTVECRSKKVHPSAYIIENNFIGFSFPRARYGVWHPKFKILASSQDSKQFDELMSNQIRIYPFASESQWIGAGQLSANCHIEQAQAFPFDRLNCTVNLDPPFDDAQSIEYAVDSFNANSFDFNSEVGSDWLLDITSLHARLTRDRGLFFILCFNRSHYYYDDIRYIVAPMGWMIFALHVAVFILPPKNKSRPVLSFFVAALTLALIVLYECLKIPSTALFESNEPFYLSQLFLAKFSCHLILAVYSLISSTLSSVDEVTRDVSTCCQLRVIRVVDCLIATFSVLIWLTTDAIYFELIKQNSP